MTSSATTASPRLQSASGSKLVAMSSPARADKTLPPSERSAAAMNAADSNAKQARQQSIGSNYYPSILTRASGSVRCGKYRSHRSSRALCCLASWLPVSHQEQPRRAKQTTRRMLLHNPEMRDLKPHVISERACHFLLINLISLIALLAALGEPIVCIQNSVLNSHNQLQLQQQQQQQQSQQQQTQLHQQRTDLDKQLLRKAFDGDQTSVSREPRSEGPRTEPAAATRQDNQAFQCPEQFGYYTDTRDCTKYYVCVFGEVLHESCTGGLRFSRELQTCDWPRNVDCPQLAANNGSSSGSTSASSVASTTLSNQMPTTTMQSVASSSSSQFPTTTPGSLLLRDRSPSSESQANTSESSLRSASLVFADEGSDPQQPSFDEAVSPVITADGNIHLHDGSGGTFSLQPDHGAVPPGPTTRSSGGGQSVDVFVKPLSVGQQQQQRARQQQVVVGSNNANRAQKLQPASLPNVGQHRNLIQLANKQTSSPQTTTSTMSGRFASDLDSETESADVADSPDSSADSQVDPSGDSIGTQADQEAANENSDGSAASQADGEQDNSRQSSSSTASSSSGYIPPVMGSQGSLLISRPTNSNNNNNNNRQQSSQLLSINSRQSISQNQFKPIIVTNQVSANNGLASNRQQHQQSMSIGDNNGNFNNNNNKFGLGQQRPRLQEQPPVDDGGEEEEDSTPPTRTSSPVAVTASAPRAISNQLRQINQTFSLNQQQQQQMNLIAQNNRQSRMSTGNFQQQFNNNQNNNILHAGNLQLANLDRSRFLSTPASSNNVNNNNIFNDSKLIRLPAATSHFEEPGEPTLLSSSHSFSPKFPLPSAAGQQQRSQQSSVLSQQQPSFGFNEPASGLRNEQPSRANLLSEPDAPLQAVLLQQQRRPRPPKRQQIPTGHNRANVNQNLRGQPDEEPAILTSTELPQTSGFSSSFGPAISGSDELATTGRSSQFSRQSTRPLVAPTTLNFQQDGFSTPSSLLMSSQADRAGRQFEAGNRFVAGNQGHSSTTTSGSRNQLLSSSTLGGEQPKMATTGLPSVSAAGDPNVPSNSDNNNNNQQPADPQMVANRYLNSAIDALEAGQPFGTVDYDFDILDNSTEHRRPISPSTGAGQSQTSTPSSSASSSSPSTPAAGSASSSTAAAAVVANRQRTTLANNNGFQRAGQAAGGLEGEHGPGENIDLTNGQPNIGQIGLNLRPQQQQQRAAQSSAANRQQVGTGSGGQQFSNVNLNIGSQANGQESFQQQVGSSNNLAGQRDSSLAPSSPTKKPRPTNKKIQVNHEQALVNNRASIEPAKRPEALFTTPTPLQTASKCDNRHCRLPDCKCGDTLTPQGMEPKLIPQVVLLTFDDAVNDLNWEIYEELFTGRVNPNGCPILATFYVSHEWTDYGQVQTLYSRGHEMASHSITHSFGEKFSKSQWFKEVNGQREILNMYGGVKMNDVRGMRAPFLQIGGNKMFEMLYDANFTYDSSMPIFENSPPLWPYTLDYQLNHECMITPCPTKSFPGVWEVGMTMWVDLRGGRCSMGDACTNPPDEDGVYDMLMKNFNRHYKSNRAPFGLFYHSAWFNTVHHRRGFLRFMSTLNSLPDVFFVTNWQMLQWMRQPTPLSEINNFEPWQCPAKNDRPPPCFHPSVCNVKSEHGTRFMKTCQPCPSNQQYPWVGSTGFKSKQANGSG